MQLVRNKILAIFLALSLFSIESHASCFALYQEQQSSGWAKLAMMLDRSYQFRDPYYWPYRILKDAYLLSQYPKGYRVSGIVVGQALSAIAEKLPTRLQSLDHLGRVIIEADQTDKFCLETLASENDFLMILLKQDPSWTRASLKHRKSVELKNPVGELQALYSDCKE